MNDDTTREWFMPTWAEADREIARLRVRVAELEDATRRAADVIGGVWNGPVETLAESRAEARDVYHALLALLDDADPREHEGGHDYSSTEVTP
jgi:hypothetical protein